MPVTMCGKGDLTSINSGDPWEGHGGERDKEDDDGPDQRKKLCGARERGVARSLLFSLTFGCFEDLQCCRPEPRLGTTLPPLTQSGGLE